MRMSPLDHWFNAEVCLEYAKELQFEREDPDKVANVIARAQVSATLAAAGFTLMVFDDKGGPAREALRLMNDIDEEQNDPTFIYEPPPPEKVGPEPDSRDRWSHQP